MRTARSSSRLLGGRGCLPQCVLGLETPPPRCGFASVIYLLFKTYSDPDKLNLFIGKWFLANFLALHPTQILSIRQRQYVTSGIHGGYRLVSTYDLPDCKPMGGWGVFWIKLWSSKIWSFSVWEEGGGIPELTLVISNLKFFSLGGGIPD